MMKKLIYVLPAVLLSSCALFQEEDPVDKHLAAINSDPDRVTQLADDAAISEGDPNGVTGIT